MAVVGLGSPIKDCYNGARIEFVMVMDDPEYGVGVRFHNICSYIKWLGSDKYVAK